MKRFILSTLFLMTLLVLPGAGLAQTELVKSDYFPARNEFKELGSVLSDKVWTPPDSLADIHDGALFTEAGFRRFEQRIYSLDNHGKLSIDIVRLDDSRAAFSLLSLLRPLGMQPGPPGDWFSSSANEVTLANGAFWVKVEGESAPQDLPNRVALSVSNRIGKYKSAPPLLVAHFPKAGYDPSSVRYFLGPKAFAAFSNEAAGSHLEFGADTEAAQAVYSMNGMKGLMSLISFPTTQLAEDSFNRLSAMEAPGSTQVYLKRAGPLLAVLSGTFDASSAEKILSSINFTYSIKWIYDKNNPGNQKTLWGVPMPILGTVVRSLILTALLCGISLFLGVGFALFRILLRNYAPHNYLDRPERTELIRLKIDEK